MSKRRRIGRERYTIPHRRSRREVLIAAGGVGAVVLGAGLLIWMLRPGSGQGTGGLVHRQPRAAWLVVLTIVGLVTVGRWALRTHRAGRKDRGSILAKLALAAVPIAAVVACVMWPGGLLRHVHRVVIPPITSTTTSPASSSTVPGATTASSATTTPSASTLPGVTTASTASPSSSTTGSP